MDFDNYEKEEVRRLINIVDLVGATVPLHSEGQNFTGICPFHDDTKPSLKISPGKQTWRCYVCDIGGDLFTWVMRRDGVEFREALQILADLAGVELKQSRRRNRDTEQKAGLFDVMRWAEQQFHQCLLNSNDGADARRYLAERGIDSDSIDRYHIGYAPPSFSWILDRAHSAGYTPDLLQRVDLARKSERGRSYATFRGRVMFPIRDTQRRPIAFGGRILPQLDDGKSGKYINTGTTSLFAKSNNLYGLDLAVQGRGSSRRLVVMEGYTDVVMARQHGIRDAVAVLGTALNEQHLGLLRRWADTVILVLDGDKAGQRRAGEVLRVFVRGDVDLRIASLPEGMDPCDFLVQYGRDQAERLFEDASDALGHKLKSVTTGIDLTNDTYRAQQALDELLQLMAESPADSSRSKLKEQSFLRRVARHFRLDESEIRNHLNQLRTKSRRSTSTPIKSANERPVESTVTPLDIVECEFFEVLLLDPKQRSVAETCRLEWFITSTGRQLFEVFTKLWSEVDAPTLHQVIDACANEAMTNLIANLSIDSEERNAQSLDTPEDRIKAVCRELRCRHDELAHRKKLAESGFGTDPQEDSNSLDDLIKLLRDRQGF